MSTLSELYITMENLRKLNLPIDERLKQEAQDTLKVEFSDEIWETLYGFTSEPIPYEPGRQIAVRVVSQFGEESSKILTIE